MKIHSLHLQTSHLESLREFYLLNLGLQLDEATPESFTLRVGSTLLTFSDGADCTYHFAFDVPENQFEAAKSWIEQRVALIPSDNGVVVHHSGWNAHAVYFYDPAGNIGELIARHNQPNAADKPFGASSLISVSEIGMVADDVPGTRTTLTTSLECPVYDGVDNDSFCAIGDENGLIILVKTGRKWFPDLNLTAGIYPFQMTLSTGKTVDVPLGDLPYSIKGKSD